jgi:hypothetical protein
VKVAEGNILDETYYVHDHIHSCTKEDEEEAIF